LSIVNAIAWGEYDRPFEFLGAHPLEKSAPQQSAVRFAVWAPSAFAVAVVGPFNDWKAHVNPLQRISESGVWEAVVDGVGLGDTYQFSVVAQEGAEPILKADPYARFAQYRPDQASIVAAMPAKRALSDARKKANSVDAPISVYEVHASSWRRGPDGEFLSWDELAQSLPAYVRGLGFTHLELLPISEHPFDGSWGYQTLGLFAPSSRFGDPEGLHRFVEACHQHGLGVILDWVPAHFPTDLHGPIQFDGTPLYEYADPKEGFHRDWKTLIYDFNRAGVRNFLTGSALYWLERYGVDGLRVDAVASMLYRDYSRDSGQWLPNQMGGRENLEVVSLFKRITTLIRSACPGALMIAEESTAWPNVTKPANEEGLGFHFKWNMGWMHDSLQFMQASPNDRVHQYGALVASLNFAFSEKFMLALSHDEVVHGKGSLLGKMSGDPQQQLAQLRAYYSLMWAYPGKKLLFMGQEFGQATEWNHDQSLPWDYAKTEGASGVKTLVHDLNLLYRSSPSLHQLDGQAEGFEWLVNDDANNQVLAWLRKDLSGQIIMAVCNFSSRSLNAYRIGVPAALHQSQWREILNSSRPVYGGLHENPMRNVYAQAVPANRQAQSVQLSLDAFTTSYFILKSIEG
jgi:1,4-alpha-glucan branching enzyme